MRRWFHSSWGSGTPLKDGAMVQSEDGDRAASQAERSGEGASSALARLQQQHVRATPRRRAIRPTSAARLTKEATHVVGIVTHVRDRVFQFLLAAAEPVAPVAALPGGLQVNQQLLGITLVCIFGHGQFLLADA
jgi:hypothetical protein